MTAQGISERARVVLKALVERHIRDGQPVGSTTLLREAGLPVSAATIRNVMSDLEERGLLHSLHTSSGRVVDLQLKLTQDLHLILTHPGRQIMA